MIGMESSVILEGCGPAEDIFPKGYTAGEATSAS